VNKLIRDSITEVLKKSLAYLQNSGQIRLDRTPEIRVEPTKDSKFGDVTSNLALLLAAQCDRSPQEIGKMIVQSLEENVQESSYVFKSVQLGGPGFINFSLGREPLVAVLNQILKEDRNYGRSSYGKDERVLIEFVSANPTGPLTLAHGRQAAVGDSLARIMKFSGYNVNTEYYLNDRGRQISILGNSVYLRYVENFGRKVQFPEDFYQGDYIRDLAREVIEKYSDRYLNADEKTALNFFSKYARDRIMDDIKHDLKDFDVHFDLYFSEEEFVQTGKVQSFLDHLREAGFVYEKDGATWFRSTDFGDDKDRVLIKNTGEMTYVSPDAAYHEDKLSRGYQWLVNIWGPDHHGYIPRLKAAVSALGFNPDQLKVIILQLATLYEGKTKLSMSTRRGEYVTLRQIIDEVGKDVSRYFFLMRRTDSHLDFDLELAKKQSLENPVYYIQYAHARICGIFEKYEQVSGQRSPITENDIKYLETLEVEEIELIKKLGLFQEILEGCSDYLDPYSLTDYLLKTAQSFHYFYTQHRVISEDSEKSRGRLTLVKAVQVVIRNGLELLGVNAPESM
jgi:arginyl-tRNA synthetase